MAYIDPTEVSPDNYKTVWEEGNRRVVEMTLKAGQSDVEHSHPNEVVYFITGGKVRIHIEGAENMEADLPDGFVLPHEAWTHRVENIGTTDIALSYSRQNSAADRCSESTSRWTATSPVPFRRAPLKAAARRCGPTSTSSRRSRPSPSVRSSGLPSEAASSKA